MPFGGLSGNREGPVNPRKQKYIALSATSAVGHNLPLALQKNFVGQEIVPFQTSEQADTVIL
jgi:hypothetical protein